MADETLESKTPAAPTDTDEFVRSENGAGPWAASTWAQIKTALTASGVFQAQGDVLDDLNTLGAASLANMGLYSTGAGALAWATSPTFGGLNLSSVNGIDIGSTDVDHDLITVGATGSPTIKWDESEDRFSINKGLNLPDATSHINLTGGDINMATGGTLQVDSGAGVNIETNIDLTGNLTATGYVAAGTSATDPKLKNNGGVIEVTEKDTDANFKGLKALTLESTTDLTTGGNHALTGDLVMPEKADHSSTPGAGFGYLWTKNTAPSTLIFTDDAGTDTDLTASASGDALVANPLSQFAATTSAQLRGVLSDETGTGFAYFQGGDLGTPSAGVGTNLTGIPTTALTGTLQAAQGALLDSELASIADVKALDQSVISGASPTFTGTNITGVPDGALSTNLQVLAGVTHKFDATTAPTVNDDTTGGYGPGSLWVDVTNDKGYVCLDGTDTAAVWTEVTQAGSSPALNDVTDVTITGPTTSDLIQWNGSAWVDRSLVEAGIQAAISFGTGVETALGVNIGSAGAPALFDGALGTPTSGTLTNCTGLPVDGITDSTSLALGVGSIELGHATDTTLSRSAAGIAQVEGNPLAFVQRYRTFWVDAAAMVPRTTNGAEALTEEHATNDIISDYLAFDSITEEGAQFRLAMPDDWDLGTIKVKVHWDVASWGTGTGVTWGFAAQSFTDSVPIDAAFPASVDTDDTVLTVGDVHVTPASSAITVGTTPVLGDLIYAEITRVVGDANDDRTADAKLLGVQIQYQTLTTEPAIW